jgi:hypothetical protein
VTGQTKRDDDGERTVFFVSPQGKDAWSGTLPASNADASHGPFATLARARDAVRKLKGQQDGALGQPVAILLRGGTYHLAEPLELGPQDSGTETCPVTYAAFEGERPVLSGGRAIADWEQGEEGVLETVLPDVREGGWTFRQLFIKRPDRPYWERRYRPSKGPFIIAGLTNSPVFNTRMRHRRSQRDFIFRPGDIQPDWENRGDIEVVALHDWSSSRLRIESIDTETHVVRFTGWPVYRIGHWYKGGRNPYYVENVKEAFDKAGDWYLDRPTGVLRYRVLPGEDAANLTAIAPRTEQLVRLVGEAEKEGGEPSFVQHIRFQGITFAHTWWGLPEKGYSSGQGMINLPAAVHAEFARNCRFERCTLAHLAAYAIRLGQGCHANTVVGCQMYDIGAGGVLVGVTNRKAQPPLLPTENAVENCVISDGGRVHFSPHGVWNGITQRTAIRHNVIRRFPYSNVSTGWCWDDRPSSAGNTAIEFNHIHDAMMLLADGGGIYSLGWQPGSVIRGNHIHHVRRSRFAGRAPNNGIFFDQGSKGFRVAESLFHSNAQDHIRYNQCKRQWQTWGQNYYDVTPDDPDCPDAAKAIAENAGLEPAFRDLADTPPVPALPLLSWTLPPPPPPPPPKPIRDDFEVSQVGAPPTVAGFSRHRAPATIVITDEAAASGKQALRIQDHPKAGKTFYPYFYYAPGFSKGTATVSLAVRVEKGADLSLEARHKTHVPTAIRVRVRGNGTLDAGPEAAMDIPIGQWLRIGLTLRLGEQADGTYDLAVTVPGHKLRAFKGLSAKGCPTLGTFMITSNATHEAVAYVDDIQMIPSDLERSEATQ